MNTSLRKSILAGALAFACGISAGYVAAEPRAGSGEYQSPWVPVDDQTQGTGKAWSDPEQAAIPGSANQDAAKSIGQNDPYNLTPEALSKMEVIGRDGKKLGKIEKVVSNRVNGKLYAVISSGGILGLGARETALSLDTLQVEGNRIHASATGDELAASKQYAPDMYFEVKPEDQPVSEFSAFEAPAK